MTTRTDSPAVTSLLSDTYLAQLEELIETAKRVKAARLALAGWLEAAERRRAALEDNLTDALNSYYRVRSNMPDGAS